MVVWSDMRCSSARSVRTIDMRRTGRKRGSSRWSRKLRMVAIGRTEEARRSWKWRRKVIKCWPLWERRRG